MYKQNKGFFINEGSLTVGKSLIQADDIYTILHFR